MKKSVLILIVLGSVVLFAGCGNNGTDQAGVSSANEDKGTQSTTDKGNTNISSSQSDQVSTENSESAGSATDENQINPGQSSTAQTAVNETSSRVQQIQTVEQASERIKETQTEVVSAGLELRFLNRVGSDYLFQAVSHQIKQQGGSGTVGFYRVTPDGTVIVTDAYGNPV